MAFWPEDEVKRMLEDPKCQNQGWNLDVLDKLEAIIEAGQTYLTKIFGKRLGFRTVRLDFTREPHPTAFEIDKKMELINVWSTLHSPKRDGDLFLLVMTVHISHDFGHYLSYETLWPPARNSYQLAEILKRGAFNHPYLDGLRIDVLKYWKEADLNLGNLVEATMEVIAHKVGVLLSGKENYKKGYQKGIDYALREYRRRVSNRTFQNKESLPWLISWQILAQKIDYIEAADEFQKVALKAVEKAPLFQKINEALSKEFSFLWENIKFKID